MKNAMQLKAIIKNLAKEKHISAQLVMQNFMLERLLERISISKYQQNFILKGGFLVTVQTGTRIHCAYRKKVIQVCPKPIAAGDFNGFGQ